MNTTLVLGIGNTLLSDEGVGVRVAEHLILQHPDEPGMTCLDGGTLSFTLAGAIAEHDNLIVVDAARLKQAPGSIATFVGDAMDRFLTGNRQSVHEVGLTDLLDIARLGETFPEHRALIGIQPAFIDWGEALSPALEPAVALAAARALQLHREWRA